MSDKLDLIMSAVTSNRMDKFYKPLLKLRTPKKCDITVIIPVRGRIFFLAPLIKHLNLARNKSTKKINILIVEHSYFPQFKQECSAMAIDYHWIPCQKEDVFNKCLCHNVGAMLNRNSQYYLFHDSDCLVFDDFFNNLRLEDLVTQTFTKRRLLYLNEATTAKVIDREIAITEIVLDGPDIVVGGIGAPGGSILIHNNLFFDVGGFDPELFNGYSVEDGFFWYKVLTLKEISSSDNEVLHMYHKNLSGTNEKMNIMAFIFEAFAALSDEEKTKFVTFKKNVLNDIL